MVTLRIIVLVLHVVAAALWLGPTLGVIKATKRALPVSQDALRLAFVDFKFRSMLAAIGGSGSLVTGLVLIFMAGGFKVVPPQIHAALGLAVLAIVHSSVFGAGSKVLDKAVASYDTTTIADADKALKKMNMHAHISHTIWLTMLVMMFWAQAAPRA